MPSVQARSQDWAAQAGLWGLAGSRRERVEVLHILAEEVRHIVLEVVQEEVHRNGLVGEEGGHNLVEEARRIAGAVAALHIAPEEVLEEAARHNGLVEEVGGHILAGVERRIAGVDLVVVGHSPVEEEGHRNRRVGADRRNNQTCLQIGRAHV